MTLPASDCHDPFLFSDGTRISSGAEWPRRRREIMDAETPFTPPCDVFIHDDAVASVHLALANWWNSSERIWDSTGPAGEACWKVICELPPLFEVDWTDPWQGTRGGPDGPGVEVSRMRVPFRIQRAKPPAH